MDVEGINVFLLSDTVNPGLNVITEGNLKKIRNLEDNTTPENKVNHLEAVKPSSQYDNSEPGESLLCRDLGLKVLKYRH